MQLTRNTTYKFNPDTGKIKLKDRFLQKLFKISNRKEKEGDEKLKYQNLNGVIGDKKVFMIPLDGEISSVYNFLYNYHLSLKDESSDDSKHILAEIETYKKSAEVLKEKLNGFQPLIDNNIEISKNTPTTYGALPLYTVFIYRGNVFIKLPAGKHSFAKSLISIHTFKEYVANYEENVENINDIVVDELNLLKIF